MAIALRHNKVYYTLLCCHAEFSVIYGVNQLEGDKWRF